MRLAIALFALGFALITTPVGVKGVAGSTYQRDARVQVIAAALAELQRDLTGAMTLRKAIRDGARSRCRGNANALVVRCTLEVARETCDASKAFPSNEACLAVADVIVTNHLGDESFIDDSDRYALMNKEGDFRAALDAELDQRYGLLAAELALASTVGTSSERVTATALDTFCVARAKQTRLPWQRCVSALVWFIGKASTP